MSKYHENIKLVFSLLKRHHFIDKITKNIKNTKYITQTYKVKLTPTTLWVCEGTKEKINEIMVTLRRRPI